MSTGTAFGAPSRAPRHDSSCRTTIHAPGGCGSFLRLQASQATPASFAAAHGQMLAAVLASTRQTQGRSPRCEGRGSRCSVSLTERCTCGHERRSQPVRQVRVFRLRRQTMFPWRRGNVVSPVTLPRHGSPGSRADALLERQAPHIVRRSVHHDLRVGPRRRVCVGTTVVRQVIDQDGRSPDARHTCSSEIWQRVIVASYSHSEERAKPWIR